MNKIIDQILDFPNMVNQKLPKNCFNEMMDNSEGSVSDWTGKIFKVGALVVLVGLLISVITGGMDALNAADGLGKLSAGLCTLVLIYAAFPIAQVIRSAGDSLAASKSGMVDFFFKDVIVAHIKALGHITALVALFGAFCATIGWVLGSDGMSIGVDLTDGFAYSYALPVDAMAAFMGMLGLEFVGGFIADFFSWDVTGSEATGYNLDGALAVGWEYVQVAIILAQLYVALAFYSFFYGILSSLFNWIKSPYLPFKSS
ncbi:MAG: hypothetical protein ABR90_00925 [Cryomorphaceae bacterium BACL29 MAG-121220-bin8]|jgi:hypothetical protein|nr:MAG: hypothetical protein ABR90_00925 [Cryomorphaceae bacterium BACL29 MAG-121220-bin8]